MRIAQVAPLWEKVPPPAYGGIELVVGLLTDELVHRGHEVVLLAAFTTALMSGDLIFTRSRILRPISRSWGRCHPIKVRPWRLKLPQKQICSSGWRERWTLKSKPTLRRGSYLKSMASRFNTWGKLIMNERMPLMIERI
jgi:glycosyltransferase involved in cell wall biosynthesis